VDPHFVAVDKAGKPADPQDLAALNDIAYDPTQMTVDLTKAEKRRTTALMLAIQAYQHLIIKDAEMFRAVAQEASRNDGPVIKPATMHAMVEAAIDFDRFIAGKFDIDELESQQPTTEEPAS
jgi:hypothetical protein